MCSLVCFHWVENESFGKKKQRRLGKQEGEKMKEAKAQKKSDKSIWTFSSSPNVDKIFISTTWILCFV